MINSVLSFLFQLCMTTAVCLSWFKDLTTYFYLILLPNYFYLSLWTNFSFSIVEIQNAFWRSVPKSEFQSANFMVVVALSTLLCIPMQSATFMSFETPTSVGNGHKTNSNKRVSWHINPTKIECSSWSIRPKTRRTDLPYLPYYN